MRKGHLKERDNIVIAICDFFAVTLSMLISMLIVHGEIIWAWDLLYWYLCNLVTAAVFFLAFRLYSMSLRSVGIFDTLKVLAANLCILGINIIYIFFFEQVCGVRTCILYAIMLTILVLLIRFSKRIYVASKFMVNRSDEQKIRAMIVGGGDAGTMLIREIQTTNKIDYNPVCIVDDDPAKQGKSIGGVMVVGTTAQIKELAKEYEIKEILIAMPSVPKKRSRKFLTSVR